MGVFSYHSIGTGTVPFHYKDLTLGGGTSTSGSREEDRLPEQGGGEENHPSLLARFHHASFRR